MALKFTCHNIAISAYFYLKISLLFKKGTKHNSAPNLSNSGITQAVTQPKIRLTQPEKCRKKTPGNPR